MMLARHAGVLFWAGRYLERAEDTARMLDVTYHGLLEAMPWEAERSWRDLLKVALARPALRRARAGRCAAATVSRVPRARPRQPRLDRVGGRAGPRERPRRPRAASRASCGRRINSFHLELRSRNLRADLEAQPHELYGFVKRSCQMISGVAAETMPRDDGWRFLMLGWMLERAEMTVPPARRALPQLVTAGATGGFHHWLADAEVGVGLRGVPRGATGRRWTRPTWWSSCCCPARSRAACCSACAPSRTTSPASRPAAPRWPGPQRILGRTRSDLEFLDTHELLEGDLHVFLDQLLNGVRQVAEAVALQYFRSAQEHDIHALDPYGPVAEVGLMGTMRYDVSYRTSIHYDDIVRGSQNELRACPASRRVPAARRLPRHHAPGGPGPRLPRLLGHPGRHLRHPRAARRRSS